MFKAVLRGIGEQVERSLGIIIVGIDGIIIEQLSFSSDFDFEQIGAELTPLLKDVTHLLTHSELGGLEEMAILTARAKFIIRSLTRNYFILLVLSPDGSYGRARYELRKAQLVLENEFII